MPEEIEQPDANAPDPPPPYPPNPQIPCAEEEGTIDVPALPADFIEAAQGPATESTSLSELSIPIVDESA
jgi:hypothetical protein